MKGVRIFVAIVALLVCWGQVQAQEDPSEHLKAVVKVSAIIHDDARTARILGTEREGNGVVIDADGHILTIGYVILEAESIQVHGRDGKPVTASFIAYDHATGFGLIKADKALGIDPMPLGESSDINVGDPILLVGHDGMGAVRPASLIARHEFVGYWEYLLDDALYVSPPHPNYGGAAMVGRDGKLLGIGSILTQMIIPEYGAVPCNMFVPIDLLKPILSDLIRNGRSAVPPKPWLGMNADEANGRVFVQIAYENGPAEKAGIRKNDIILRVDQKPVTGLADFYRKVWALGSAGVKVPLSVLQGDQINDITIDSADRYHYLRIRPTTKKPPTKTEMTL